MSGRWTTEQLGEAPIQIIDGDRGKNYPKQTDFYDSGHCLFLNAGNVTQEGFAFDTCQFISEHKDEQMRKGKLARQDVVMTTRGTIGNVAYYGDIVPFDDVRINSGMVIFRCDREKMSPLFLYQYLRSLQFHGQVNALRSGVAQPQLPIRDMKRIKLPIPKLSEQNAVATILSAYDDLIENNRRRIQLLEQAARLLYKEWFVYLRFPGHEHTRIVNGVPEGWAYGCLSDFYNTASGGTPSRTNPDFFTGEILWVKTKELLNGFVTNTEEKINENALKKSAATLFPERTVLVAMYGATIGQLGIIASPAASNQACCAIIPRDARASFIHAFLFFWENKEKLVGLSMGAAQKNINQQIIRSLPMLMPQQRLMEFFNEALTPVFDQLLNLQNQNQKLKAARDLLLPRLMNGKIII